MKKIVVFSLFFVSFFVVMAQETSVRGKTVVENAARKSSVADSVAYLKKNAELIADSAEKRAVYVFLAGILEQQGLYQEAQSYYVKAAGMQGRVSAEMSGLPNRNSEELVIDAVRCALCAGDYRSADSYLNSSVRNSKDEAVVAYVKLYEQWSILCRARNKGEIQESVAILRTYAQFDSMKCVRPIILLTLWHLTGDSRYAEQLKTDFSGSLEASIVKGEVQNLPTPFWYFVPRNGVDIPEISSMDEAVPPKATASGTPQNSRSEKSDSGEKAVRQQLGLFREEANARRLLEQLKENGFSGEIATEVRPSGTMYYLVVVNENKNGTMGDELRSAGFECYPLFE